MRSIITNIAIFQGIPFEEPCKLFIYRPRNQKVSFFELGFDVRRLRQVYQNHTVPIFQHGSAIYATCQISDYLDTESGIGILTNYEEVDMKELYVHSNTDRDILRHLSGELIATHLRNLPMELWKVAEITQMVYQAQKSEYVKGFGMIDVYPGFRYSPLIFENGKAGVIIDPRFRFFSNKTLRDYIPSKLDY